MKRLIVPCNIALSKALSRAMTWTRAPRDQIYTLQYLRVLATLIVAFNHRAQQVFGVPHIFPNALRASGVDIFLVVTQTCYQREGHSVGFLIKHFALSLTFVSHVHPMTGAMSPLLRIGWTLLHEMRFHLLFTAAQERCSRRE